MNTLAWLTASVAGWFWIRALMPRPAGAPAWARAGVEAGLAFGFGTGAAAALFFALLWQGMKPASAAWTADGAIMICGAALWWVLRRRAVEQEPAETPAPLPFAWMAGLAAAGCLAAFFAAAGVYLRANPQGDWDAWGIWNLRAKFLAHEGLWRNAVSPEMSESHPEYPLLWPAAVARVWSQSGELTQAAPQAGAFFSAAALVLLFGAGLAARVGWPWAAAGTTALLMSVTLWRAAPGQYADIPLALLLLGAVMAAEAAQRAGWSAAGLALSGMMASLAAFTKNEGLAFLAILCVALAVVARRRVLWWLAGAAPVLALTLLFHFRLAPAKAVISGASFRQIGRLATVVQGMAVEVWHMGDFPAHPLLFVALLFAVFRPKRPWRPLWPAVAALALLAADAVVLWGAPSEAAWQVSTAADRLLLQVTPVLLLCAFLWLAQARESAVPVEAPGKPERRRAGPASSAKG